MLRSDESAVCERLVQIGERIREERTRRSFSREQLARKAGLDRKQIERLENGEAVRAYVYFRCAWVLGFDFELVPRKKSFEATPCTTAPDLPVLSLTLRPQEFDDVDRRLFISSLAALAVDASITPSVKTMLASEHCPLRTATEVEQLVADCAQFFQRRQALTGGGGSLASALAMFSRSGEWRATAGRDARMARALEVLSCDLGVWVGQAARVAGRLAMAERYLSDSLTRARLFGLAQIESRALEQTARLWRDYDRPDTALQSALLGVEVAPTKQIRALMHFHAAAFSAKLGDESSFERHADVARSTLAGHVGESPPWLQFLTTGKLSLGLGYLAMGRTRQAIECFQEDPRDPYTYRSDIVHSQVLTGLALGNDGDATEAGALGLALVSEVQSTDSQIVQKDLHRLRDIVARNQFTHPFVAAYDHANLPQSVV